MAEMSRYCKAYPARELRQFPGWHEQLPPLVVQSESGTATGTAGETTGAAAGETAGATAGDTAYFYLHDNYVVTAGLYRDENIAFGRVTDEWRSFCSRVLEFTIPDTAHEAPA